MAQQLLETVAVQQQVQQYQSLIQAAVQNGVEIVVVKVEEQRLVD